MDMDQRAIKTLALAMYLHYCGEKGFTPYPGDWVPRWAMDYATVAVRAYGYEEQAVDELRHQVDEGVAA